MQGYTIKPWILLLMLLGLGFYLGYIVNRKVEAPIINNYITDTIQSSIPHQEVIKPTYEITVRPRIVVNYPPGNTQGVKLVMSDSLLKVIDSLNKKITLINTEYIKQYPSSPKIVYGKFTRDSLQMDLLETTGLIHSLRYPVNYTGYEYQLINSELQAKKLKKGILKPPATVTIFGGYSILTKNPLASVQYQKSLGKIVLSGEMGSLIRTQPELFIHGKIGINLNKK